MMKRMMGLLLAAVMLLALTPAVSLAASEEYVENRSGAAVGVYENPTDETAKSELKDGKKVRFLGTETEGGEEWYKTEAGYIKKASGIERVTVKTAELSAEDVSVSYDGKSHKVSAKVIDGEGYKIEYSKDDGKTWSEAAPSLKNPGKLTVRVRATKESETTLEKTVTLEVSESAADGASVTIVNCKTSVNVRKGPGSTTAKIGSAKKGKVYRLLGVEADGKWYKIQYTATTVGYVFHDYVKVGSETPTPDPEPTGKTGTIVNCKTQVNVREKASSKSKLLGVAKKGETFEVLGTSGSWVKIRFEGKTAYIYKTYIKVGSSSDPEPAPTGKTGTIVNCKTQVNVREKASSKSKLLGVAKKGETFEVLGTSGSWVKIRFEGKTAYVYKTYIKVSGSSDPEPAPTGTSVKIVNCKTAVNVRKGPSSATTKIGSAKKGKLYQLLGVEADGKWYKIQYTASVVGYVFHNYVKVGSETPTPDPDPTGKTGTIVNCKTQVNVREKASSKSKLLGVAKKGETFEVLGKSGNWVKIDYNGKTAYVYKTYIKIG